MTTKLLHPAGRPRILIGVAVVLLLSVGQQVAGGQEKGQTFTGTIEKVGEGALTVRTAGPEGKTDRIRIEEDTRITLNGEEIDLEDLDRGDQVKITTREGDRSLAADIRVSRGPRRAEEQAGERGHRRQRGDTAEQRSAEGETAEERGEAPAVLGLVIATPPGEQGVVAVRVVPRSPAAQAGLQEGDEIVSVDGEEVASPAQLGEFIREKEPGAKVKIAYRRDGEEKTATAQLISREAMEKRMARGREPQRPAEEARRRPGEEPERQAGPRRDEAEQPAWLGVLLDEADEQGARIVHVAPGGPAEQAGLQRGDVIRRIDGRQIDSPQRAGEMMEDKKPGDEIKIVVLRDDEEKTLTARLAAREEGRQRFRMGRPWPWEEGEMEDFPPRFDPRRQIEQQRRIEQTLRELREDLRRLQKEVADLKKERSAKP